MARAVEFPVLTNYFLLSREIQGVPLIGLRKYFVTAILIVMILIFPSYYVVKKAWTFDLKEKIVLLSHSQGKNEGADLSLKNPLVIPENTEKTGCSALLSPIKRKFKCNFRTILRDYS